MADMAKDLERFKTKTAHSTVPVDTIYNTGMRNEMDMGGNDNCCAPMTTEDWAAQERKWKKSHEWREFIQDGCIEPKG